MRSASRTCGMRGSTRGLQIARTPSRMFTNLAVPARAKPARAWVPLMTSRGSTSRHWLHTLLRTPPIALISIWRSLLRHYDEVKCMNCILPDTIEAWGGLSVESSYRWLSCRTEWWRMESGTAKRYRSVGRCEQHTRAKRRGRLILLHVVMMSVAYDVQGHLMQYQVCATVLGFWTVPII